VGLLEDDELEMRWCGSFQVETQGPKSTPRSKSGVLGGSPSLDNNSSIHCNDDEFERVRIGTGITRRDEGSSSWFI
jgi:hypothetical protein